MNTQDQNPAPKASVASEAPDKSSRTAMVDRLDEYTGLSPADSHHDLGHLIERDVQHQLLVDSAFHISSLVVHRVPDGICLEGTLWTIEEKDNLQEVSQSASTVQGVKQVLNHLVLHEPEGSDEK